MKAPKNSFRTRIVITFCASFLSAAITGTCALLPSPGRVIECSVYPAVPQEFTERAQKACRASRDEQTIVLANGFISARISPTTGVIVAIENKLTGETHPIRGDQFGYSLKSENGEKSEWYARAGASKTFEVNLNNASGNCEATLTSSTKARTTTVTYTLKRSQFWIERRLSVESGPVTYDQLCYGRANISDGKTKELRLGKFDSPRLISAGKGGIFSGVGWWFYEVEDGLYQNTGMNYQTEGRFDAEPWYVGVFQPEPGEPYPGWFWYKTFLSERKLAHDKQQSYFLWNARSGYSFAPINNPDLLTFVDMAAKIGLDGITTGEVRGLTKGTDLAATNAMARKVIDAFAKKEIDFGLHEGSVGAANWASEAALQQKLHDIDKAREQGIRNLTVDFFRVTDRFADHRRVATFFRHIRDRMDYTECHLGMAVYGPQFQREVLINHPTDLKGFDISRFSSDWATLLGFRHSRREWQKTYEYLMPENGLFYFCTHYSNYPRRYQEPEPQQFLYIADAWRGLAYAFHDKIGFRDSLAAQSAFSTFYVFGFFDSRMPKYDAEFARKYLAWVEKNSDVLNRGRVCFENEDALVMSKIRDGRGAIYVLNYTPGEKQFRMKLEIPGEKEIKVRQVYPTRGKMFRLAPGKELETKVAGERLTIFEINGAFKELPPENPSHFPIDVTNWQRIDDSFHASFVVSDVRKNLARQKDNSLPKRVVSADQTETEILINKPAGKSMGKLPREFLNAYGFEQDKFLPTWKAAPWAFADRVWLVYIPEVPPTVLEKQPVLRVNGKTITMVPRVRYDPKSRLKKPETWDVPMWFADVTDVCNYGAMNEVVLAGIGKNNPATCFITSSSLKAD